MADEVDAARDCHLGLLYGGLIGDALGGPIEFTEATPQQQQLVGARHWPDDRRLNENDLSELAGSVPLLGYEELRPDAAPYGPWRKRAPAGTLTDDSRHKMVLMRALHTARQANREIAIRDIAQALIAFEPVVTEANQDELTALNDEGFREYRYAARWILGFRDLERARPVERLWSGVNNCSGQMMLPPLAVAYAGKPLAAYRKAFEIDFIDTPMARDMASALVAGLAAVLSPELDSARSDERWQTFFHALRHTDPFAFREVPFAGRQLHKWLDKSKELVDRAEGSPKRLYQLLESEGRPVYWWDAHFTLLVPMCMIEFCRYQPMAAMHLTLDFGHDTDSYAQVLGCMVGAVHGLSVFPPEMVQAVARSLKQDYGEDVSDWLKVLHG